MAYRIDFDRELGDEIRRIAGEQLDKALDELDRAPDDLHPAIHRFRKRAKKLRGLLRLVRDEAPALYDQGNATVRDVARRLSALRDAQALVETAEALREHAFEAEADALATLHRTLQRRREAMVDDADTEQRLTHVRSELGTLRRGVEQWPLERLTLAHLIQGARRTYRRGREGLTEVNGADDAPELHEVRKRAKYSRYHHRLLQDLWPGPMKAMRNQLDRLGDVLGDHHDLAVLGGALDDLALPQPVRLAMEVLLVRRRHALYAQGMDLARRIYVEKPDHFARRLAAYADAAIRRPTPRPGQGELEAQIHV